MVNTISCPSLCVFAPLREALPGLYHQSPHAGWESMDQVFSRNTQNAWPRKKRTWFLLHVFYGHGPTTALPSG
jgi:hypothetical protein